MAAPGYIWQHYFHWLLPDSSGNVSINNVSNFSFDGFQTGKTLSSIGYTELYCTFLFKLMFVYIFNYFSLIWCNPTKFPPWDNKVFLIDSSILCRRTNIKIVWACTNLRSYFRYLIKNFDLETRELEVVICQIIFRFKDSFWHHPLNNKH